MEYGSIVEGPLTVLSSWPLLRTIPRVQTAVARAGIQPGADLHEALSNLESCLNQSTKPEVANSVLCAPEILCICVCI